MVGAWCFADHMGPADVTENSGLDVEPHPHIGLQTVSWLIDREVLHRDSMGSDQVINPGQLNLMTSGGAVSHAEEANCHYRGVLEGIQLWVALPEVTRHGDGAFEHHVDLPLVELEMHDRTLVPLNPAWEYVLVVLEGRIGLDGRPLPPASSATLAAVATNASWAKQDERFGRVRSSLPIIPAKAPFWQQNQRLR